MAALLCRKETFPRSEMEPEFSSLLCCFQQPKVVGWEAGVQAKRQIWTWATGFHARLRPLSTELPEDTQPLGLSYSSLSMLYTHSTRVKLQGAFLPRTPASETNHSHNVPASAPNAILGIKLPDPCHPRWFANPYATSPSSGHEF